MEFRADLHLHSRYSFDSKSKPGDILRQALKKNLNVIAVTDHDTVDGGLAVRECAGADCSVQVVVGMEVSTRQGDIVGLFLEENILSVNPMQVLEEIHNQGGVSVLVHPCRHADFAEEVINSADAIEIYNAKSSSRENLMAQTLAIRAGKKGITSSDAHLVQDIGSVYTSFEPEDGSITIFNEDFLSWDIVPHV